MGTNKLKNRDGKVNIQYTFGPLTFSEMKRIQTIDSKQPKQKGKENQNQDVVIIRIFGYAAGNSVPLVNIVGNTAHDDNSTTPNISPMN